MNQDLEQTLVWLAAHMKALHGLSVHVHTRTPLPIEDRDVAVLVFRFVRELLFNVVKHAGVDQATVEAWRTARELQVQVVDQGTGFDPMILSAAPPTQGGFGLFSVRERLHLLGGQFHVDSRPGAGTRTTLRLPLAAAQRLPSTSPRPAGLATS
jgi:signal transduction histidine kinase